MATQSATLSIGDRALTPDGQIGIIQAIFETPWDTLAQGSAHTRTVALIEGHEVLGHWFLDRLQPVPQGA